ncbi:uncharacterized protein LOC106866180 [Brachypodium distachyon]|uniref:uncharacterized protein LOC106866180 n=1 Tax=Brachypodium distachyon TaxID=15368 RepID=UPI00071DB16D|nr:uncharacterized protein LOC106866180 [Brachypodium distachyon]|eukprot:XP_014754422.1 uncharacterized protein LOC106866180 [Brachypodium distachyon]
MEMSPDDTAYSLWRAIKLLVRDNHEAHSVYVHTEYRSLVQGELSVLNYCSRMKELADTLRDLGSPVMDRDLVLNLLHGLGEELQHAIPHLTGPGRRFPTFLQARSFLPLEEHRRAQAVKLAAQTAFFTQMNQVARPSAPTAAPHQYPAMFGYAGPTPASNTGSTSNSSNGGRKNKGKGKKKEHAPANRTAPPPASTPAAPWIPGFNPWTGMVQAWPLPQRPAVPAPGILGPRPAATAPQHSLLTTQRPTGAAPAPPPATYDPALIQAFNNMSMYTPASSSGSGEWFLDTGASSYMGNNSGSANPDGDSAM